MNPTARRCRTALAEAQIARCAVRALYAEVTLEPKPGLVSLRDSGSHADMTASTFVRSLFALRHYFKEVALAGRDGQPFEHLQRLGMQAEQRMLCATGGINTHRGAIFSLGLLCAAAGLLHRQGQPFTAGAVRGALAWRWGDTLQVRAQAVRAMAPSSNGQRVARRLGLRTALDEAAEAFPVLFEVTVPAFQAAIAQGVPLRAAKVHGLFATMARLDDTNVAHRGGLAGLQFVQAQARRFIAAGSVAQPDWLRQARALHAEFVARRLSPGGAADLVACACWLHGMSIQDNVPQTVYSGSIAQAVG